LGGTLTAVGTIVAPSSVTHGITALATAAGALPATTAGPIGLAHGAMKTMTLMKIKIAAATLMAFTLLGTGGAIATHYAMAAGDHSTPPPTAVATPSTHPLVTPVAPPVAIADADATFVKQFKADWQTISLQITNVNPATAGAKGQSNSRNMILQGTVDVLDTTHVLGFDRFGHLVITRLRGDDGKEFMVTDAQDPNQARWYAPLSYSQQFNQATKKFDDVLAPYQFQCSLNARMQLPTRIKLIEAYLTVLTYQSMRHVDLPFVANGAPVEVLPGMNAHFDSVQQDGENYRYSLVVDAKKQGGFFGLGASAPRTFDGQLQHGESLPKQMVTEKYWIDSMGNPIERQSRHSGNFVSVGSEGGSGGIDSRDKIAAMRFEIAEGLAELKLPITLENIDVPQPTVPASESH
jgi:hypothetical protein